MHFPSKRIPLTASDFVAAVAIAVLIGWIFAIEPLMTVLPGLIRMKPNTALALLFAAIALRLANRPIGKIAQGICGCVVLLLGALSLLEYLGGVDLKIDQLMFRDPMPSPFPGRMAHFTAASLIITGFFLYPFRSRGGQRLAQALALTVGLGSAFAVVGYAYGVPLLYGSVHYTSMAIHTGIAFLFLSFGFLCIDKEHGLTRIFRAQTSGGTVARRLVPLGILIPILVGLVFLRFNFGQLRLALVVMSNVVLTVAAVWALASALDRSETERLVALVNSEVDALTNVYNRGHLEKRLAEEVRRCVRHLRTSAFILFDVDHFKSVNDRFGHQAGDGVLKSIADACRKTIRSTDILCRFGGEEFAIIAPETCGKDAMILAGKLRAALAPLLFAEGPVSVTISLGVSEIGRDSITPGAVIAAADEALYRAKTLGRNRECLSGEASDAALTQVVLHSR